MSKFSRIAPFLAVAVMASAAASAECVATTDIEEARAHIQRACGERMKSVSFMGNHAKATFAITYDLELSRSPDADTVKLAFYTAARSNEILQAIYPMLEFTYSIRDREGIEVYRFVFTRADEPHIEARYNEAVM